MKKIGCILLMFFCLSCLKEEAVPVVVDFDYEVINNDYSIPVSIIFFNRTEGADDYEWRFEGANISRSVDRNPGVIIFNEKGTQTISLTATNIDGSEDTKTLEIKIDDPVTIDFTATSVNNLFPPATYNIRNDSEGANSFIWTFEEGEPESSTEENPEGIVFETPGEHQIFLEVSNGRETYTKDTTVVVLPYLVADFNSEIDFKDDDYQIPVKVKFINTSISATDYTWTFEGATITSSNEKDIELIFNEVGEQQITLIAENGKEVKSKTQRITFFRNTNLRELKNVKLGVNTAHQNNSIGSFFSIAERKVYTKEQITRETEKMVDIVFYGLNSTFIRNEFISPDLLSNTPFTSIQNPKKTVFINAQELCNCPIALTSQQFDEMEDDNLLHNLTIVSDDNLSFSDSVTPRIILFKTQEGEKGAIKINQFVEDGDDSYILIDIKVQKETR
ncbi:PKD domain-containing protein [uncultured Aquimarina sp.]|uniref:PKD domain-containing protein n=1 Tax=uncultured Aquimarina sp. TaxID=575652 RepID=UPI002630A1D6|nr:PKD domain-containing protein [uncultured Aquimarina sp.]